MESYSHDTGSFTGKGGVEIFFQKWLVEKAKGLLVIVHGIGEHSGRYDYLLKSLAGKKISVFAIDHRGHGKSDGKRGHIDSFMDYVYDLKLFIEFIKEENRGVPIILYGHSMGGVIATRYSMTYPDDISMLVLSSPGFATSAKIPEWKKGLANFFSSRISSLSMSSGLKTEDISHDPDEISAYENDPLVHDRVSARWAVEFFRASQDCLTNAKSIRRPLLVFHGKSDNIADYRAAEEFFNSASSSNKKIFLYEGLYHETIHESPQEREKVLKDVTGWIVKNLEDISKGSETKETVKASAVKPAVKKAAPKAKAKPAVKKAAPKAKAKPAAKKAAPKAKAKPAVKKAAPKAKAKPAVKKAAVKKAVSKKPAVKKTAKKK